MIGRDKTAMARYDHAQGMGTGERRRAAGGANQMAPLLLLLAASLLLAACAGSAGSAATPTPTPHATATATATPVPSVLFQADWSQGLAGWNATPGWKIVNGALQSDAGNERTVTIPYRLAVSDYEVEVSLQIVSVPQNGGSFVVQALPAPGADGYQASVIGLRAPGPRPFADHPNIQLYINPLDSEDASSFAEAVHDFEPGPEVRQYVVQVQGPVAQFWVDGRYFSAAESTKTPHLSNSPIQLQGTGAVFRVTAVRILSL